MTGVPQRFVELIAAITGEIANMEVAPALAAWLTTKFPPGGDVFDEIERLCREGVEQGWLCAREAGGIRFGRPVRPQPATHGFSVDVVAMADIAGPHHAHPHGEIDMVMPLDPGATFDEIGRGWKVYSAESAHRPRGRGARPLSAAARRDRLYARLKRGPPGIAPVFAPPPEMKRYNGSAVVYFVCDKAKCEDAPPTEGCSSRTRIRKCS
jgi:hypothetical protein